MIDCRSAPERREHNKSAYPELHHLRTPPARVTAPASFPLLFIPFQIPTASPPPPRVAQLFHGWPANYGGTKSASNLTFRLLRSSGSSKKIGFSRHPLRILRSFEPTVET